MASATSSSASETITVAIRVASQGSRPGLSSSEAQQRLNEFGPNEIRREAATSPLILLARQFASPVIWLLCGATVVSLALGELLDAFAIVVIVIVLAILAYYLWAGRGQAPAPATTTTPADTTQPATTNTQ